MASPRVKVYVPPKTDNRYLELVEGGSGSVIALPDFPVKKRSAKKRSAFFGTDGKIKSK